MTFKVPLGSSKITESHISAVNKVLESQQISPGPVVTQLEKEFSNAHGARFGLFVNSGTDALRIALATLKEVHRWDDGDEVLVPAVTFVATVNAVLQNNLTPVFVDVCTFDYGIDRHKIRDVARSNKARAIIPVHLFGHPNEMRGNIFPFSINDTAKAMNLKVIEDSCECMGVAKLAGDIACYSTYVCHLMSTGVGGLAVTNNPKYARIMRSFANHGRSVNHIPGHKTGTLKDRFVFDRIGYSARATEIQAALGLVELKNLSASIKRRRAIAWAFNESLNDNDLLLPICDETDRHAYMMYPIVIQPWSLATKWKLCSFLEKHGIETREMLPLINQPCYKKLKIDIKNYPVADHINRNGFYIGCHPGMSDDDVAYVISVFKKFFRPRG